MTAISKLPEDLQKLIKEEIERQVASECESLKKEYAALKKKLMAVANVPAPKPRMASSSGTRQNVIQNRAGSLTTRGSPTSKKPIFNKLAPITEFNLKSVRPTTAASSKSQAIFKPDFTVKSAEKDTIDPIY